jgi:hypothetical protein
MRSVGGIDMASEEAEEEAHVQELEDLGGAS